MLGLALAILLVSIAVAVPWPQASPLLTAVPTTAALGEALAGPLLLPFMAAGLVLLASVIGAVTLARQKREEAN